MCTSRRNMDLDAASWSRLPSEIVEKVLSFLSVPDLCRYQTVCKTWNELIRNPVFCTSHARNARCREPSFLVVRNRCDCKMSKLCTKTPPGISFILDMNLKRWYEVDDNYFHNFSSNVAHSLSLNVVAMDGSGLVCQDLCKTGLDRDNVSRIIVRNLLGDSTSEVLPTAPVYLQSIYDPTIHLVVDKNYQTFKIFLLRSDDMNPEFRSLYLNIPLLQVYDSTTNDWKTSNNPSRPSLILSESIEPNVRSSVMFQGILYVLFLNKDPRSRYILWRYKHSKDVWEKVQVDIIHGEELKCPELVVSADRLFLVTWCRKPKWYRHHGGRLLRGYLSSSSSPDWVFQFREFKVSGDVISSEVVFELSKASIILRFCFEYDSYVDLEGDCPDIYVFGIGKFLVIMSDLTGEVKVFDVVTRELDRAHYWPPKPMSSTLSEPHPWSKPLLSSRHKLHPWSWFGNHMNLLLPNTPSLYGGSPRIFSDWFQGTLVSYNKVVT